jgi:hypothetical protein
VSARYLFSSFLSIFLSSIFFLILLPGRLLHGLLVRHLALLLVLRGGCPGEGVRNQAHAEREGHAHDQGNELSHVWSPPFGWVDMKRPVVKAA